MSSMASAAGQPPDRLAFVNNDTGDTLEVQYNPSELQEQLEAVYQRLQIVGMSHEQLQYINTKNLKVSFDLNFDSLTTYRGGRYDIMRARNKLLSYGYSRRGGDSIRKGAPPRVIMLWPNLYTLTCKLVTMGTKFTSFQQDGKPTRLTSHVEFEEIRDMRLWGDDVEVQGTQRGSPELSEAS